MVNNLSRALQEFLEDPTGWLTASGVVRGSERHFLLVRLNRAYFQGDKSSFHLLKMGLHYWGCPGSHQQTHSTGRPYINRPGWQRIAGRGPWALETLAERQEIKIETVFVFQNAIQREG